ncbi:MAG TPA: DNA/RNA non-specific endonuclease [Flavobacteriaceae bacterium]|jgi:endonuclease G|nr:DNA/RNA non-specific endonuclease [Flavobacteriaceae bacterium]HIN99883.1 DNA/RNA non-specific endonuclease [Flavobacteriaceae bacterium]|tara:strand:- start:22485 stop:23288 length:804 start_codon:yes stop_codon:yes gene_type:complete
MNRKLVYPLLIILVTAALYYAEKYVDEKKEAYPNTEETTTSYAEFNEGFLPSSTTGDVVTHQYYTLSYVEAHEQAEWVAYELKKEHLKNSDFKRPYFVADRSVASGSADWRNYKNSGYDRGHLCPAADREFDYDAYHETFLTSNISPQNRQFNGGIWNRLEQKTRYWAKKYDGVFVVTGGVLRDGLEHIGDEEVSVPQEFYKIILDKRSDGYQAIAFLIPNEGTDRSFYDYAVPIDAIEAKTGIDFFPKLSKQMQASFEASVDRKAW